MTTAQIIFLVVAAVTLGSAFMVVTTRNLIHAALWPPVRRSSAWP